MAQILENRVKEITASTGTGVLTLAGTLAGFRTFASKCVVGDTFRYTLQSVDSTGIPTDDWEIGIGTYSASNQITRSVLDSSNAGAAVNLSAGTKHIWIGMDAVMGKWIQERLSAARTYYVRTDGSDSNTGLVDSAGGAFLTIQKAVDAVAALDMGKFQVTVQVKDGAYTGAVSLPKCRGDLIPIITGNLTTPSNVHLNVSGNPAIGATAPTVNSGIVWHVQGVKLSASSSSCLYASGPGNVITFTSVVFGVAAVHMSSTIGGKIIGKGTYWIAGSANLHLSSSYGGEVLFIAVGSGEFLASVTFSAFAWSYGGSTINALGIAYVLGSYTCTGKRYEGYSGANIIPCNGGFPGNAAGTLAYASYWGA